MFKNIKIGKKLGLGFGIVLFMLLVVSWNNFSSFHDIGEMSVTAQDACSNHAFSIEKEVDHLKWMAGLSELFLDKNVTEVTVVTDDHECGLGKWMYSDETQQMCAEDPQLKDILEKIEEPHHRLHSSAIYIDEKYVDFDIELKSLLAERWIDHLNWIKHVANSNLTQTTFDGGLDPRNCAFGKWYYAYTAEDPEFGKLLKKWEEPHKLLHESAQKMVQAQNAGNWKEAKRIYQDQTLPVLSHLEECYHGTHNWINETAAKQEAALAIYEEETRTAVAETQKYLEELKEHFNNKSETATSQTNAAISSSISIMSILVIAAVLIGLGAAFIITRGITKPIGKVVELTNQMNDEFDQFVGVVDAIANNDLTQEIKHSEIPDVDVKSKDEIGTLVRAIKGTLDSKTKIGESMTRMTENLNSMIGKLLDNANQLVTAATEISSSSEEMAAGAKDQTQQAAQVSTAIEEMTATIIESSKNANEAKEVSEGAAGTSAEGQEIVGNTIEGEAGR